MDRGPISASTRSRRWVTSSSDSTHSTARCASVEPHPLVGCGSLHAGVIAGGAEFSTYPSRCVLEGERRTVPGESSVQVEAELDELLRGLAREDPQFKSTWRTVASRQPLEIDEHEEIVRLVREHAGTATVSGERYWTDAALIAEAGIPAVVFGPGGEGAHADVEWVSVADVERCAEVFVAVAAEFCA